MISRRRSLSRYVPGHVDVHAHFRIACADTYPGFAELQCLPARIWAHGLFELLSPAWRTLGYHRGEIAGRGFCDFMDLPPDAARAAMEGLLSEGGALRFGLRRRDGSVARYHWQRQFDDFTTSMFVVGEELAAAPLRRAEPAGATPGHGGELFLEAA